MTLVTVRNKKDWLKSDIFDRLYFKSRHDCGEYISNELRCTKLHLYLFGTIPKKH